MDAEEVDEIEINHGETQYYQTTDNLITAHASLRLQLQSSHFGGPVPSVGTGLVLRCTATIGQFYQRFTEVELGVPQRDPIPARG
ncbi:hypothetical protein DMENIID0001_019670 [Sergentomyia squamirostris]